MSLQLLLAQVILLALGLMGVATARPDLTLDHGVKALLALLATVVFARVRPQTYLKAGPAFWSFTLVLLLLTLFFGTGTQESPGVKRWLMVGPIEFQPSELAKLGLILQISSFFSRRGVQYKLISASAMIAVTAVLILMEPDLGTGMLTLALGIVMMFATGVGLLNISGMITTLVLLAIPTLSIYLDKHPYIRKRWLGHIGAKEPTRPGLDQIGFAHRDLTFGGWWGQGLDGPRWYYFAAHTDMIIATIGFATGVIGVVLLLCAFWIIVSTALNITRKAAEVRPLTPEIHGAATLATGSMFMIVGQAVINLGVAAGKLPVTGIPLPLVSYGFSSMLTVSIALAIIHSATREIERALEEQKDSRYPAYTEPDPAPETTEDPLPA